MVLSVEDALWDDLYRDGSGYVYLLVCRDDAGKSFVKIGCTIDPVARIPALFTACPLEPKEFAICEVFRGMVIEGNVSRLAHAVEGSLHRLLSHKRIRGEWFGIDIQSPDDKAEFTTAWRSAIATHKLTPKPWKHMSMADFRKKKRAHAKVKRESALEAAMALYQARY